MLDEHLTPIESLDVEDVEDLLFDCFAYISENLQRKQPKYMTQEGFALLKRLRPFTQDQWLH